MTTRWGRAHAPARRLVVIWVGGAVAVASTGAILAWSSTATPPRGQLPAPVASEAARAGAIAAPTLRFEPNRGQTDPRFPFVGRGVVDLSVSAGEVVFPVGDASTTSEPGLPPPVGAVVGLRLVGARADAPMVGLEPLAGRVNYLTGGDPASWQTGLPTYGRLRAQEVYPGIDVVYRPASRGFEYDFIVAPGADPRAAVVAFEGTTGMTLDASGDLLVHTTAATFRQHRPIAYQDVAGLRRAVAADYVLDGDQVWVRLGAYDASQVLVIDPELAYSTFLGRGDVPDVSPGPDGSAYLAMEARGGFPTQPGTVLQPDPMGGAALGGVARFNQDGQLAWATYLGPSHDTTGVAVDAQGNAYVTGWARDGFPTTSSRARSCSSGNDTFLAKLDSRGEHLLYSTCVGITSPGEESEVVVAGAGLAYVATTTPSGDFPIKNAFRPTHPEPGAWAVTLSLFDTNLSGDASMLFSTYVSSGRVAGMEETADGVVLTGTADFTSAGPPDVPRAATNAEMIPAACAGGLDPLFQLVGQGFLLRFRAAGAAAPQLAWSACLGPVNGPEVAVDPRSQRAYVSGALFDISNGLVTTANAYQPSEQVSTSEVFLAEFDMTVGGSASLRYLTQLGGDGEEMVQSGRGPRTAVAVGLDGHVFVVTTSTSTDLPVREPFVPSGPGGGGGDLWTVELDTSRSGDASLVSSSVVGGTGREHIFSAAVDPVSGHILMAGTATNGTGFPITADAALPAATGLLFLRLAPSPTITSVVPAEGPACGGTPVVITGTRLSGTTATFGGTPALGRALSDTSFGVVSPPHAPGVAEVVLASPAGARATGSFTYTDAGTPVVSGVSPASGPAAGGTPLTITGSALDCATSVSIGGVAATGLQVVSDTQLTATTPAHAPGPADVIVTVDTGAGPATSAASASARFTYIALPVISAIAPACGPLGGATPLTVTGSGLTGASAVRFGDVSATVASTPASTDTSLSVLSPPATAASAASVTVTTPGGTSAATPAAVFSYPCPGGGGLTTDPGPGTGGGGDRPAETPPPAPPSGGTSASPQGGFANNPGGGGAEGPGLATTPPPAPTPGASSGLSTAPPVQAAPPAQTASPSAPPAQAASPSASPGQAASPSSPPVQAPSPPVPAPAPLGAPAPPGAAPVLGPAASPVAPEQGPEAAPRHAMVRQDQGVATGGALLGATLLLVVIACGVVVAGALATSDARLSTRARPQEA